MGWSKLRGPGRIELPREEIVGAYEEGSSTPELAKAYGVSRVTILNRLREWNVEVRTTGSHGLGKHHSEETRRKISEGLRRWYQGNPREWKPDEDNGGSVPSVSETPSFPIDARRQQILDLEEEVAVAAFNLRQAHNYSRQQEQELALLKGGMWR